MKPLTERIFKAEEKNIDSVIDFTQSELARADCPVKLQTSVCVAIEEIFVNIAKYAYPDSEGTAKISIDINEKTNIASFIISDNGIAFDPLKKDDPDITLPAEKREIGGLGIFIVKKTMDSVGYTRKNGENILTMTKKLEGSKKI